jgi:hypothetical protein
MRVGLVTFVTPYSERVRNKMELPFDGHSLLGFQLLKMAKAARVSDVGVCVCTSPSYEPFKRDADFAGVPIIPMSEKALNGQCVYDIFEPSLVEELRKRFDIMVHINICYPFLLIEDFCDWIRLAYDSIPRRPCFEMRTYLYDSEFNRIDGNTESQNSKTNNPFYQQGSQFSISHAKDWGTMRQCELEPYVVPFRARFRIDIDTMDDIDLAYAAWDGGLENMKNVVRKLYAEHSNSWKCTN